MMKTSLLADLPHMWKILQINWRSLVWMRVCRRRIASKRNLLLQPWEINSLRHVRMMLHLRRWVIRWKLLLQIWRINRFICHLSGRWIGALLCAWARLFVVVIHSQIAFDIWDKEFVYSLIQYIHASMSWMCRLQWINDTNKYCLCLKMYCQLKDRP